MKYALTIFPSVFDNKTNRKFIIDGWDKMEELLRGLSEQPGFKPKKGERSDQQPSPLITPALYKEGKTRANKNVVCWAGWCAMDIDNYEGSYLDVIDLFEDYQYICYSSASSTKEHPKFRMVFPLTKELEPKDIKHFWFSLNTKFNSLGDPQTKDLSRMYYVPATYPGAFHFFKTNEGKHLNPDELMNEFEEYRGKTTLTSKFPDAIQQQLTAYRKAKLTNTAFSWNGYRDCPFCKENLSTEYREIVSSQSAGRYRKLYSIMVSIATKAIYFGYPISAEEIQSLCLEIDAENGGYYQRRSILNEAERAIEFALKN